MRFNNVHIDAIAHVLPERVVTSLEIEDRLAPAYARLGFHPGRIELMTGIRERRHFEPGTRPSAIAIQAAEKALAESSIKRDSIGLLIFSSVCRDFMEPATASVVHAGLKLPASCACYDLSNACLGFANAMIVAATAIELGHIEAALIVAGEDGGPLVEATIKRLNEDTGIDRRASKLSFASLTIGSGAAAMVLTRQGSHKLLGGVMLTDSTANHLCQGGMTPGAQGPLMQTDSEALMHAGVTLAQRVWAQTRELLGWDNNAVARVFTHQVGVMHRKLLFEKLELDASRDYPTVETLGNMGSVSLPISLDLGARDGRVQAGDKIALLGIGSGLVCLNLGVQW
ncbi:MAG: 3-oxoacyl-ACP synthase III [Planctomycetes bacterium]|nr:3-oxoacyl-ACP synthase III [Planctomycetota bacterium]MCW8136332.1 3-oxoacyl-ACP synthase III [Planctomycetota bacterium]